MFEATIITSRMADVAVNLTGLIPWFLYMLLRSNANWTMIQPIETSLWSRKRRLRLSSSANMDVYDHMTSPVSLQTENSPKLMHDPEKALFKSSRQIEVSEPQVQYAEYPIQQQPPKTEVILPPKASLTRLNPQQRVNYAIFPTKDTIMARESVSTTFSQDDEDLELPKPLFFHTHKRELSQQSNTSSATVQIGLRLSLPHHVLTPIEQSPVANGPDLPLGSTPTVSTSPVRGTMSPRPDQSKQPSSDIAILPIQPNEARTPSQILSPRSNLLSPSWIFRKGDILGSGQRQFGRGIMKSLPPVPAGETPPAPDPQGTPKHSKLGWSSETTRSQAWI